MWTDMFVFVLFVDQAAVGAVVEDAVEDVLLCVP